MTSHSGITLPSILVLISLLTTVHVRGHGRLLDPPSRASMWRFGFQNPANYDDNQLYCGGIAVHYDMNGGKCGICGDPWNGPLEHEAGGKYANGIIVRSYSIGQTIDVTVQITANHLGWMEFKICPNNDPNIRATQECLDKHVLAEANTGINRILVTEDMVGPLTYKLKLPDGLDCTQCVLQWKYNAGNSWGMDSLTGRQCLGCGHQENFYACSDVAIGYPVFNWKVLGDHSVHEFGGNILSKPSENGDRSVLNRGGNVPGELSVTKVSELYSHSGLHPLDGPMSMKNTENETINSEYVKQYSLMSDYEYYGAEYDDKNYPGGTQLSSKDSVQKTLWRWLKSQVHKQPGSTLDQVIELGDGNLVGGHVKTLAEDFNDVKSSMLFKERNFQGITQKPSLLYTFTHRIDNNKGSSARPVHHTNGLSIHQNISIKLDVDQKLHKQSPNEMSLKASKEEIHWLKTGRNLHVPTTQISLLKWATSKPSLQGHQHITDQYESTRKSSSDKESQSSEVNNGGMETHEFQKETPVFMSGIQTTRSFTQSHSIRDQLNTSADSLTKNINLTLSVIENNSTKTFAITMLFSASLLLCIIFSS